MKCVAYIVHVAVPTVIMFGVSSSLCSLVKSQLMKFMFERSDIPATIQGCLCALSPREFAVSCPDLKIVYLWLLSLIYASFSSSHVESARDRDF